jgi:two-component system, NarL family, response regulator DevR
MAPQSRARQPPTGCSVVLVEDHPLLRRRFAVQLAEAGLAVVATVGSCAAGLVAVRNLRPSIVVVDSRLADGRGIEFCRNVRREIPHVVMLLHTRLITATEEQEAFAAGVAAVVPKAIRGRALVSAVLAHGPGRGCR